MNCPHKLSDWEALAQEAGYRVGALARLVGVSTFQLRSIFRANFQITPKAWLKRLEFRKAAEALPQGGPKGAFAMTAFSSFANFSAAFSEFHGFSPSRLQSEWTDILAHPELVFTFP